MAGGIQPGHAIYYLPSTIYHLHPFLCVLCVLCGELVVGLCRENRNALPPFWAHGNPDAGLHLRRDALQQSWNDQDAITPESQKSLEACVWRALELGINHIETARGYGTSEEQLGRLLPQLPRDKSSFRPRSARKRTRGSSWRTSSAP